MQQAPGASPSFSVLPPGYRGLVPLDKEKHKGLGVAGTDFRFAAGLNSIYLTAAEFIQAARHYPIVFAQDSATGYYLPLAVTGLSGDRNLFVSEAGAWAPGCYVPAYVRRWPFYTAQVADKGNGRAAGALICVDETALSKDAEPLFDAAGRPSAAWEKRHALIEEMEAARRQTERLAESLAERRLLESFEARAFPKGGQDLRLRGMFRVNENKLNALDGKDLKRLMKHGELSRIHAHLMSLDNFRLLLDRAANGEK